jgi:putative glutamine amidotransferase
MDWQAQGSFSPRPHYAIRESYFAAVHDAGGFPIGIPLLEGNADTYLAHVQGLVIPGGDYPSPSRWYDDGHGIPDEHPRTVVNEDFIRKALVLNLPLLGICGGEQELAVATGGLLYWRVADAYPNACPHRGISPDTIAHKVQLELGSRIQQVLGTAEIEVNSAHNEAVKKVGPGVKVVGHSPDGVIEAIEVENKTFAIGVQWHPEFGLTQADHDLFVGLVEAAKTYRKA